MFTVNRPHSTKTLNAPASEFHFCPACHEFYLENPQESSLFRGLKVCPHCRKQDNDLFAYWMNYKPLIEREKAYKVHDHGAFLVNDRYSYIAFRACDGSWDYTLIDDEGELVNSGQIGDEQMSFMDAMEAVFVNEIGSIHHYEEIPWTTAWLLVNEWQ